MAQNFVRSSFSVHNVIVNQRIWLFFDVFLLYPGGIAPLLNSSTQYQIHIPGGGGGRAHQQFKCPGGVLLFLFDR